MQSTQKTHHVIVSAIAADSSGAKMILFQFLNEVAKSLPNIEFYVFIDKKLKVEIEKFKYTNIHFVYLRKTKNISRLFYDIVGFKYLALKLKIPFSLLISLQNTLPFFTKSIKTINYIHQPNSYTKESIPFKRAVFYKLFYKFLTKITSSKQTTIVVQTNWLKERILDFKIRNSNILVLRPSFNIEIPPRYKATSSPIHQFIYPATDFHYKNHHLIIDALSILNKDISILVKFTISDKSWVYKYAKLKGVLNRIKFLGHLSQESLAEEYHSSCALIFPSIIESFGLPLIEAQAFQLPIIASKTETNLEVCNGYSSAIFLSKSNPKEWASYLESFIKDNPINLTNGRNSESKVFKFEGDWSVLKNLISNELSSETS